jgi:hypothetical protein
MLIWWRMLHNTALLGAVAVAAVVFAIRFHHLPETVLAAAAWTSAAFLGARRWRSAEVARHSVGSG